MSAIEAAAAAFSQLPAAFKPPAGAAGHVTQKQGSMIFTNSKATSSVAGGKSVCALERLVFLNCELDALQPEKLSSKRAATDVKLKGKKVSHQRMLLTSTLNAQGTYDITAEAIVAAGASKDRRRHNLLGLLPAETKASTSTGTVRAASFWVGELDAA
jgi:hypothetical protein